MELVAAIGLAVASLLILAVAWNILKPILLYPLPILPPTKSGLLPWVGCAIPFGKEPLLFIQRTRKELHSTIFTIHAAGKRLTFVIQPELYQQYFTSAHLDFQAAVQPYTQKSAGVSPESFSQHHSAIHDAIKGKLVPAYLSKMCPLLSAEFYDCLSYHGNEGEMNLMDFVRHAMFEAVVKQLFGSDHVPKTKEKMRELEAEFVKYDADFEYASEIPEIFLKDWRKSKYWLLAFFKLMVEGMKGERATSGRDKLLVQSLLDTVDEKHAHNYTLLLLWASQANAVPAVFWILAHIVSNPDVYRTLKSDLKQVSITDESGEFQPISEDTLRQVMSVKRCVLEGVRLHAPGMIVRKVTKTLTLGGFTVPSGHLVAVSPYWAHRDPQKFPNPLKFDPDRWLQCDLDKNQFLDGYIGFGGGRYQCPGRWFATMEMHLFVAMVIKMFDLELVDPLPPPSPLHLFGIPQPERPCRVKYRRCGE